MTEPRTADIDQAARWLADAERVVVLTGAGVSAESGVPTFRGAEGLWRRHDPMSLATPEAFARDPRGVWAWYRWRQRLVGACTPNDGHRALVELQRRVPGFLLVTQNVDGLHHVAGSTDVVTLHGDLFADRCTVCGAVEDAHARPTCDDIDPDDPAKDPALPTCAACGGLTRPGVVWFGESLPDGAMERAAHAASRADVLLVAGTSGVVYPAAGLATIARRGGGKVVVINLDASPHDDTAHLSLRGRSGELLPRIMAAMHQLGEAPSS